MSSNKVMLKDCPIRKKCSRSKHLLFNYCGLLSNGPCPYCLERTPQFTTLLGQQFFHLSSPQLTRAYRKLDAAYSQLTRRLDERIQLRVIKSVVNANCDTVKEKGNAISEERAELDKLFEEVWAAEDNYCNRIWSFAAQHQFDAIYSQYPEITRPMQHACPYNSTDLEDKNYFDADVDTNLAVSELRCSIASVEEEMAKVSSDLSVKREIERSLQKLEELRSTSEQISGVLKLIDEHARKERENRKRQNAKDVLNSTFVSAKKIAKCSVYYPRVLIQRENLSALMKSKTREVPTSSRFTVKKQSEIALKFEKRRAGAT